MVSVESETRPTMNAHEFINYELEYDLNNPYKHAGEIISMLDERDDVADNEPLEEVENVQIGDVVMWL